MSNRRPTPTHTPPQATGTEKAKFKEQAARDFESILLSRARELRPGGHLVIANFAEDPRGWWLGKTDIGPGMYDTMDRLWRGMAEEGLISKEEYERTTFCNHYRTEEEAVGAFAEGEGSWVWAGTGWDEVRWVVGVFADGEGGREGWGDG